MRSPLELVRRMVLTLLAMLSCAVACAGSPPTPEQVDQAIAQLRADPNLAGETTVRTLRWDGEGRSNAVPDAGWFSAMLSWIADSARVLMWVALALLAAFIIIVIVRQVREFERAPRLKGRVAPTHVRDLDIRPESLPDDIGGSALKLWRNGDHRPALSLLYRGLLSRLVHTHAVPIRASSTEGECVQLASDHVTPSTSAYVARLIGMWQQAVYGARDPDDAQLESLCREFDSAMGHVRVEAGAT